MRRLQLSIATLTAKTGQTVYHTQKIDFKTSPVFKNIGKTKTCACFSSRGRVATLGQNKVVGILKKTLSKLPNKKSKQTLAGLKGDGIP